MKLVFEPLPGLPPAANRLPPGDRPWVPAVMDLVGLDQPGAPVRVLLAPETSPLAVSAPPWVAGYTDGVSNTVVLLAQRTPSWPDSGLEEVLAHEVAHVLVNRAAAGRPVPRWFDEGVAMLAARPWRLADEAALALTILSGPRTPLWKLDDLFAGSRRDVERAYALSGTLVTDLVERYGTSVPRIVLAGLARGDGFDEALRAATGTPAWEIAGAFWERQGTLRIWIPVLTSTTVLWFGISVLAVAAAVRRRRRKRAEDAALAAAEAAAVPEDPGADGGGLPVN